MTVWEKTLINLQKGYAKLASFAAICSDRVKAEITMVRLRMQIDDIQAKVREQQQYIGQKLLEMKDNDTLPTTFDLLFRNNDIASAVDKIERYQKDREILLDDLRREAEVLKPAPASHDERSA
ncbi:MAG: hypothetical protein HGB21_09520 [Nitrospirae bacterium]|nr:hypothetical protein [Nitrospirota bacterium]NTW66525.1 hypothetical protein [Nitrospirota bacterium]